MSPVTNNFNFCPACFSEGSRFLEVTDAQQEELNQLYQAELKKKDEIIGALRNAYDIQQQKHQLDTQAMVDKLQEEHEALMKKIRSQHADKVEAVQRALEVKYKSAKMAWEDDMKRLRAALETKTEECVKLQASHKQEMEKQKLEIDFLKENVFLEARDDFSELVAKHEEEIFSKQLEIEELKKLHDNEIDQLKNEHMLEVFNLTNYFKAMVAKAEAKSHVTGKSWQQEQRIQPNMEPQEALQKLHEFEQRKKQLITATAELQELAKNIAISRLEAATSRLAIEEATSSVIGGWCGVGESVVVSEASALSNDESDKSSMMIYNAKKQVVQRLMKEIELNHQELITMQSNYEKPLNNTFEKSIPVFGPSPLPDISRNMTTSPQAKSQKLTPQKRTIQLTTPSKMGSSRFGSPFGSPHTSPLYERGNGASNRPPINGEKHQAYRDAINDIIKSTPQNSTHQNTTSQKSTPQWAMPSGGEGTLLATKPSVRQKIFQFYDPFAITATTIGNSYESNSNSPASEQKNENLTPNKSKPTSISTGSDRHEPLKRATIPHNRPKQLLNNNVILDAEVVILDAEVCHAPPSHPACMNNTGTNSTNHSKIQIATRVLSPINPNDSNKHSVFIDASSYDQEVHSPLACQINPFNGICWEVAS